MKAFNVAFTLICEECGYPMRADEYNREMSPGIAIWRCETSKCTERGKTFRQQLPQVNLTEVQP